MTKQNETMEQDNTRLHNSLKAIRECIQELVGELNRVIARECPEMEMIRITNELSDLRRELLEDTIRSIEAKETQCPDCMEFSLKLFNAYRFGLTAEELKGIAARTGHDPDLLYGHYLGFCHRMRTGKRASLTSIMDSCGREAPDGGKPGTDR